MILHLEPVTGLHEQNHFHREHPLTVESAVNRRQRASVFPHVVTDVRVKGRRSEAVPFKEISELNSELDKRSANFHREPFAKLDVELPISEIAGKKYIDDNDRMELNRLRDFRVALSTTQKRRCLPLMTRRAAPRSDFVPTKRKAVSGLRSTAKIKRNMAASEDANGNRNPRPAKTMPLNRKRLMPPKRSVFVVDFIVAFFAVCHCIFPSEVSKFGLSCGQALCGGTFYVRPMNLF